MPLTENARCDTGAVKAGRRFTSEYTQNRRALQASAEIGSARWDRNIEHLHRLGPRPTAELLIEIARDTGRPDIVGDRVEAYAQLDRAVLRAVGGDRFPPIVLGVVRLLFIPLAR